MPSLFEPIKLGSIDCANRVFMAPLTRGRAGRDGVPTEMMVQYYAERSHAGLIISEGVGISEEGHGWPFTPGLWTEEQVLGWQNVTRTVHSRGGKIVAQLWHMGRMAHSNVSGRQTVAPSAISTGGLFHTYDGKLPAETPKALTHSEIQKVVQDYGIAARNAIRAGFDGVQLHAANGYLVDEFLKDSTNHRTDVYGTDRVKFLREVTDELIRSIGAELVGVRFSPTGDTQKTYSEFPEKVFIPAAKYLQDAGVAWLELREPGTNGTFGKTDQPKLHKEIRKVFKRPLILNQDYTRGEALRLVDTGEADGIAFGRPFISNPDLVERLKHNIALTPNTSKIWYKGGRNGYLDWPSKL